MCCWRTVFVVFTLIIVMEAKPWRPKKVTSEAVKTLKYVRNYNTNIPAEESNLEAMNAAVAPLVASITPVDNITLRNKQILHKAQKDVGELCLSKPLEIDGVKLSGVNNWFILDDYHNESNYQDGVYYEYYQEYTEEFWEETVYEYDVDDW